MQAGQGRGVQPEWAGNRGAGGLEALRWAVNMELGVEEHSGGQEAEASGGCKGSICHDEEVLGRSGGRECPGSERPRRWTELRAPTLTAHRQPSPGVPQAETEPVGPKQRRPPPELGRWEVSKSSVTLNE